jgi:hypothetical protein
MPAPSNRPASRWAEGEQDLRIRQSDYYQNSPGLHVDKLEQFSKYVTRQTLARFLALYEIFKLALEVQGDVIEGGVNWGGGLMSFAHLSAILEPVNMQRRVIGFDTFSGFPSIAPPDLSTAVASPERHEGGYAADAYNDLLECIELYDANRAIGHIAKIVLVKGDATETIPKYVDENPHTVVSLLHLDFDIYEPTMAALDHFVPRMPKGAVIVFDELNHPAWPGETRAVAEKLKLGSMRIRRFPFEPHISYATIE